MSGCGIGDRARRVCLGAVSGRGHHRLVEDSPAGEARDIPGLTAGVSVEEDTSAKE